MDLSRRDFLRATSAIAAAWGLHPNDASAMSTSGPNVIWLQAQSCSGCSVSFLNSISIASAESVLTDTLNVHYHSTLMASAGNTAVQVAQSLKGTSGYILVVEGAIPTGASGRYCYLWPGLTAYQGVQDFARNAKYVIALGTCPSFGCVAGAKPNPTAVQPLSSIIGTSKLINISGCPTHPDWLVGTVSYILKNGTIPALDGNRRPTMYYGRSVHDRCPYREQESRCLKEYGCKGPRTRADCPNRKWNAGAAGGVGVNWCVGAGRPNGTPCLGCTDPLFPDGMSPFYREGDDDHYSAASPTASDTTAQPAAAPQAEAAPATTDQASPDLLQLDDGNHSGGNYQHLQNQKRAAYEQQRQQRRKQNEERKRKAASKRTSGRSSLDDE